MITTRQSTTYSAAAHAAVLGIILLWGIWRPYSPAEIEFDSIEVIDAATFDALVAQSRTGDAGQDEQTGETEMVVPVFESIVEVAPEPIVEEPVEVAIPPVPEPAFEQPPERPEIVSPPEPDSVETPLVEVQPQEVQPLPQAETAEVSGLATPESIGQEQAIEPSSISTPPARDAAAIREIAAIAERASQELPAEAVEVEEVAELPPEPAAPAAEPEASVSEIRPEADIDAPISAAPAVAIVPTSRPSQLDIPVAPVAEVVETAQAATTETTTVAPAEAPTARIEEAAPVPTAETSEPSIDDLLASVVAAEPAQGTAQGRGLSRIEQGAITQAINNNWNKTTIIDKTDYGRLIVVVRFQTNARGALVGGIDLLEPTNPDGDFSVAFTAAQNAILKSMPLDMPADIDPSGILWTMKFDPANSSVGLF